MAAPRVRPLGIEGRNVNMLCFHCVVRKLGRIEVVSEVGKRQNVEMDKRHRLENWPSGRTGQFPRSAPSKHRILRSNEHFG